MRIEIQKYKNVVLLTGAGVSVASGLRTYRGPGGVWEEHQVEEYAHADCFKRAPEKTWMLFGGMRSDVLTVHPNQGHLALAQLEARLRPDQSFLLVTQNVDELHQRAGSKNVAAIHGDLLVTRCSNEACDLPPYRDHETHATSVPLCPECSSPLRPDVVLFGEMPKLDASWAAKRALRDCDLFLAIGTSGLVTPAADYVRNAQYAGARTIYLNLEPLSPPNPAFQEQILGRAEELLPKLFSL